MASRAPSWKPAKGWRRDAVHYPARPLRPLDASFVVETVGPGTRVGFAEWSLPMAGVEDKVVNGWVYTRTIVAGDPPDAVLRLMGKLSFLAHLWRVIPPLRKSILAFDRWLEAGGFEGQMSTWDDVWRPEAERRIAELRRLDIASAPKTEIADQLDAWREYLTWQWGPHIRIHLVCFYMRGKFAEVCRRLLGLSDLDAYELVKRSDPVLFEAPRKLAAMARRATGDPAVEAVLRKGPAEALEALRGTWFEEALEAFLDAHGDVPIDGFEPSLPTWRESPERVVARVKQMLGRDYDPDAEDASHQLERKRMVDDLRAKLDVDDLAEFDRWLAVAEQAYPLNDTHNHVLFELPVGLTRYTALRAGDLLTQEGALDDPADVFFLSLDELTSALRDGAEVASLVPARKAEFERAGELDPPEHVGEPLPVPKTDPFPPRVAEAMLVMFDQSEKMYGSATATAGSSASSLSGIAGSPGIAEGRVCVVTHVEGLDKVREGDVLVCPITGPAWTVVFPIISGLVTEAGGALSHPAIVAREFGVPSVVGTGNATRVLRDGQLVRVDGTNASVDVI